MMGTVIDFGVKCFFQKDLTGEKTQDFLVEKPLSAFKSGDYGIVHHLEGGEKFRMKMIALGIIPGKTIVVIWGQQHQPYVLRVDESRVMVDWETLKQIFVQPGKY
jgi:Fe2+ transport system protein FeoA